VTFWCNFHEFSTNTDLTLFFEINLHLYVSIPSRYCDRMSFSVGVTEPIFFDVTLKHSMPSLNEMKLKAIQSSRKLCQHTPRVLSNFLQLINLLKNRIPTYPFSSILWSDLFSCFFKNRIQSSTINLPTACLPKES
jgi:hypothetical protein